MDCSVGKLSGAAPLSTLNKHQQDDLVFYNLMASGLIHFHNTNSFDIELTMMFAEFYQPGKLAKLEKWSLHVI